MQLPAGLFTAVRGFGLVFGIGLFTAAPHIASAGSEIPRHSWVSTTTTRSLAVATTSRARASAAARRARASALARRSRPVETASHFRSHPPIRPFRTSAPARRFQATTTRSLVSATVTRSSGSVATSRFWADASLNRAPVNADRRGYLMSASAAPYPGYAALGRSPRNAGSSRFSANANVMASCVVRTGELDFGDYVASADFADDVQGDIRVTCSAGQSFDIALGAGHALGATVAARSLTSRSGALPYSLYTSPRRRTVWGDGSLSTSTMSEVGNGFPQTYTVFGRIQPGQYVPPGRYGDTFDITLSY